MSYAVCIRCGQAKRRPEAACPACRFTPRTDEDKAKSLILSTDYDIDGEDRSRPRDELTAIGVSIAAGQPHQFSGQEVTEVVRYAREVLGIGAPRLARDALRWLAPPLALLALVFLVLWLT